jgi:hypothetical protein
MNPTEDPTSIGAILMSMGAVTEAQIEEVIEEQRRLREDALLGRLLVAKGYCTQEQFEIAMAAQTSMRDGGKERRAMAVADISLARSRRRSVVMTRRRIIEKGQECVKKVTGEEYAAITPDMLVGKSSGQ